MRLALYQPDIPQNTGTILRTAACFAVPVDVIGPAGFDISDRALRRAAMDYIDHVELQRHIDWPRFEAAHAARNSRLIALSAHAETRLTDFAFEAGDTLLFGRETAGLPDKVHAAANARLRIPVAQGLRSLNVAVAAAITLAEALRQTEGWPI